MNQESPTNKPVDLKTALAQDRTDVAMMRTRWAVGSDVALNDHFWIQYLEVLRIPERIGNDLARVSCPGRSQRRFDIDWNWNVHSHPCGGPALALGERAERS